MTSCHSFLHKRLRRRVVSDGSAAAEEVEEDGEEDYQGRYKED